MDNGAVAALEREEGERRAALGWDSLSTLLQTGERLRRRGLHAEYREEHGCMQALHDAIGRRAKASAQVQAARRQALLQRARAVRNEGGRGRGRGPRSVVVPFSPNAGENAFAASIMRAVCVAAPTPGRVTTAAENAAAERAIAAYEQTRVSGLLAARDLGLDRQELPNEMYVTRATVLESRMQLLCEPFNGFVGAFRVVRELLWTVCRGCRQQRAALASGREAVSGFDPAGFLGDGFAPYPPWSAKQAELTIATSAPFLAMSPTADLLGHVTNLAHVSGLCRWSDDAGFDPSATDEDRLEAANYLTAATAPIAELGVQLGTFLTTHHHHDGGHDKGASAAAKGSHVRIRVPVGWPRPLLDPATAVRPYNLPALVAQNGRMGGGLHEGDPVSCSEGEPLPLGWVVPRDRVWVLSSGWHSGTGLPPTLDMVAKVVPAGGTELRSVSMLRIARAQFARTVFTKTDGGDADGGDDLVVQALRAARSSVCVTEALLGSEESRTCMWLPGLRLAMTESIAKE